ncbi:MAG: hypothetical protein EOP49_40540, partial [Sphingobacteriales bacterium]
MLAANPGGITLDAAQMAGIRFDPDPAFVGNAVFNYAAYDNSGNLSNLAAYTIPVEAAVVLPLSKLEFTARRNGNNIALRW